MPTSLIQMQRAETVSAIVTQVGVGITFWSALWGWLGDNHHAIASCGVMIGIVISLLSYRKQRIHEKKLRRLYLDQGK